VHHLGEHEVKHGVRIEVFNIFAEEFGNPEVPSKLVSVRKTIGDGSPFKGTPIDSSIRLRKATQLPFAWTAAAICFLGLIALAFVHFREPKEDARVLKMSVLPPEKAVFKSNSLPAVSPDGRRLAFVATLDGRDQLWVRDLDSLAVRALMGTEGADEPFWSPDSRTIAFFAGGKLKKIDLAGGPAVTLSDAVTGRGGTWNKDDVIVFGTLTGGTFRVSAAGGSAAPLTKVDAASGEESHKFPWFLPDGHHFLYTATPKTAVYVADLDSKDRRLVVTANSNAVYTPPGYLLFVRERMLMAQPFDVRNLETTGDAIPIADQVDSVANRFAQNQFSASENGVLAYTSGSSAGIRQLTWFDRSGKALGTLGAPGLVIGVRISPDGKTVAFARLDHQTQNFDVWLHDLMRGATSRFTFGPKSNANPVWSPDGSRIAFTSDRDGIRHVFQKATTGTARDEVLDKPHGEPPRHAFVGDWSRDGRYIIEDLVESLANGETKSEIWVLPLFGDRKAFPYLHNEFNERNARLSPDGQWLAYTSDESKRNEIYVQTFPGSGGKWQISTDGGQLPVWSVDGKELYFTGADGKLMAADVKGGPKFEAGVPKPLFDVRLPGQAAVGFDVSKDGRFLIPVQAEQAANMPMTVVVNWTAGLKK
jgi:Tol biopolymer transport system component